MEIQIYLTTLVTIIATATAIAPQTCPGPDEWFTSEFVALADAVVPVSITSLSPDVDLKFFKDIMLYTDQEIEDATQDAIEFFSTKYGLDFSASQPDELGQRFFENATFFAFEIPPEVGYTITFNRWIVNGRPKSLCFPNRDGGFLVSVSSEQTLRGAYGGPEGKQIQPGEGVSWGFYNIPVCPQQPLVIHYESGTPFRFEPVDGLGVVNCDLFHRVLGRGVAQGLFSVTPMPDDPTIAHWSARTVFTFPAHPSLPSDGF